MAYSTQDLLLEIPLLPVAVASLIGVLRFRRLERTLQYLVVLIWCTAGIEIISRIVAALEGSNLFLLPLDTICEFGLLAWIYRRALSPSAVSRWIPAVVVGFSLVSLLSCLRPASMYQFNTVQRFVESLLVLGFVLLFFYKTIRELVIVHLEREPLFWVSFGLLLYFAGNVFIFISSNYFMQHSRTLGLRLWDVHALLYMVLFGIYSVALWISPSTKK